MCENQREQAHVPYEILGGADLVEDHKYEGLKEDTEGEVSVELVPGNKEQPKLRDEWQYALNFRHVEEVEVNVVEIHGKIVSVVFPNEMVQVCLEQEHPSIEIIICSDETEANQQTPEYEGDSVSGKKI